MVEHTIVTTTQEIYREGENIPVDSKGTIVHVYPCMNVYLVEFQNLSDNPVVTIYKSEIVHQM